MEVVAFIIGMLILMLMLLGILVTMCSNLSEMKTQLCKVNKELEKMALHIGAEEVNHINDEKVLESLKDLVKKGRKISAIKKYRNITGKGLKESKEKIDNFYETLKSQGEI